MTEKTIGTYLGNSGACLSRTDQICLSDDQDVIRSLHACCNKNAAGRYLLSFLFAPANGGRTEIMMKKYFKQLFALMLALCLLEGAVPGLPGMNAAAAQVDDYELLFSNENVGTVSNNPPYYLMFDVSETIVVQSATTYHWNGGKGQAPGSISIYNASGSLLGTYAAEGRTGYRGVPNAYWDIFPNIELSPGTYYLLPSDTKTWAHNAESDNCGFFNIRGYEKPAASGGYTNSSWAAGELADALAKGLFPDRLRNADLTKPISRADFAAVSVKVYEYLSGTKAASGTNPFRDTSDPEVVKAYHLGIVNGTGASTFSPSVILDREQTATMLTRAYKRVSIPGWTLPTDGNYSLTFTKLSSFADDYAISSWAKESVYFMAANQVINGVGSNRFAPGDKASAEQALVLAVRMANKLKDAPAGAEEGKPVPAKGTVTAGDVKLTFGSSSGGTVTVSGNQSVSYDGYSSDPDALSSCVRVALSEIPKQPITLSVKLNQAPSSASNVETFLFLGFEYKTESGNTGVLFEPVHATVSGGYATVSNLDLSAYADYVETVRKAGTGGSGNLTRLEPVSFHFLVQAKQLQFFSYSGGEGTFKVYASLTDKQLTKSGAEQFLKDISGILAEYHGFGFKTTARTSWPFEVFIIKMASEKGTGNVGQDGTYVPGWTINGAKINLNAKLFKDGYTSKTANHEIYRTMVHELFHFIQNCYVHPSWGALWFDEASASYYEYKLSGVLPSNYNIHHMRVFDGFIPSYATVFNYYSADNGYARLPVVQYLQEQAVTDKNYLRAAYAAGGNALVQDWAPNNIEKVVGKNIRDMVGPFFEMYVLDSKLVSPPSLTPGSISTSEIFDSVRTKLSYNFSSYGTSSTSLTMPPYGARFAFIRPLGTPVDAEYVINAGTKDAYVVAMLMQGSQCIKTYTGKEGKVTVPAGLHDLLVMVVNRDITEQTFQLKVSATRRAKLTPATAEQLEKSSGELTATIESYEPGKNGVIKTTGKLNLSASKSTGQVSVSIPSMGYTFSGAYDAASGMLRCPENKAAKTPAATLLFTYSDESGGSSNPFEIIKQGGNIRALVYDASGKIIAAVDAPFSPFKIKTP